MEFKHNKNIDESLKFEISHFSDSCFDIYKNLIDDNIKKSFDQLYQKIDTEIKTNISQKIGGNELYNYDDMPELKKFNLNLNGFKDVGIDEIIHYLNQNKNYSSVKTDIILNLVENEKIIYFAKGINPKNHSPYEENYLWITNFGTILYAFNGGASPHCIFFEKNEFWIPVDYICIIKRLLYYDDKVHPHVTGKNITSDMCHNIRNTLKTMKETLYNRKFVPLYVKDVVEENEQLKAKYDKYEKDIIQFANEKKDFETKYKPHLDLIKEKENIEKEKDKLSLVSVKLAFEKRKLDEDIAKFNEEKNKINSLNVNDILGI